MERNKISNSLTVSSKIIACYTELQLAEQYLKKLKGSLEECIANDQLSLVENIGKYAREMPRFRIFTQNADYLKQCIRKICTGEISLVLATKKLIELQREVEQALSLFNEEAIKLLITEK